MSFTRTITVVDHEVHVRTTEVPDAVETAGAPAEKFTGITGGRRTAALTAAGGLLVVALALTPALTALFH